MQGIFQDALRIGTVAKFAGEPRGLQWVAWSIHRKLPLQENRAQFRRRCDAIAWLMAEQQRFEVEGRRA